MNYTRLIFFSILLGIICLGSFFFYKRFIAKKVALPYKTEKPSRRDITQLINATGSLEAEDTMKIGSLVQGIIRKMYVEEDEHVVKGDLLAEIDDSKEDTDVRATKGDLEQAKATLIYQKAFYFRQKALYEINQISKDEFEKVSRDYTRAQEDVAAKQARYEQAKLIFDNKKIRAPRDGLVIAKNVAEGETVTTASPPTIIYTIASDITKMEAKLSIDENTIGDLKVGQKVSMTFDTYPDKKFVGAIHSISSKAIEKDNAVSYEAMLLLDNKELLLRPGMTVNARITIAKKKNVFALPGHVFTFNTDIIERIAKAISYSFKPLDKKEKKKLKGKGNYKTIWIVDDNSLVEKAVAIGINDNVYFEILDGLTGDEEVIVHIEDADVMKEFYKKMFGTGI